jgi:uncharacterized protein DUF1963
MEIDHSSSRRGFFRRLAGEIGERVVPFVEEITPREDPDLVEVEAEPPGVVRARPTRARVTVDELLAMAVEVGLGKRLDAIRDLARDSVRVTLGDAQAAARASCLGEAPPAPREPFCPVRLDLAEVAAVLGAEAPIPHDGMLSCIATGDGEYRVVIDDVAPAAQRWRPVDLSVELQLPRVGSESVQVLELDTAEHDAWQELREQLAERQGVDLHDATWELQAIHRVLGYPDEPNGDMPLICELLARGHELGDDPVRVHPRASEAEPHVGRWRMLLQLTIDDELGWSWGEWRERLYLWIDEQDLADGDFTRVRAISQ